MPNESSYRYVDNTRHIYKIYDKIVIQRVLYSETCLAELPWEQHLCSEYI